MIQLGRSDAKIFLVSIALSAVILLFDLSLPLGVASGVPYVALVLIGLWTPGERYVLGLAALATSLTFLGYFYSPSGGVFWVVLTNRALAVFAIWITAILIAHRKQAEKEVQQHLAQLKVANKELDAFAYTVSHDLRAPLRAMDGFSQAVLEDCDDKLDSTAVDYLNRISGASKHMGRMLDDILALSRTTRGEMIVDVVDLSAIAESILTELAARGPDRRVSCEIAPHVTGEGDPRFLRVVLENLMNNAWKFTSKQDSANITFGTRRQDSETVYFVRDDGAGFDMAYADRLFGIFERLHSVAEFEGTGIGLAVVSRLIKRHGGRIWAEAAEEQGATFYFTLGN